MNFIADLHVHSPYSRATSRGSSLAGLASWAEIKGVNVIGTGDFTQPAWFKILKDSLLPAEPGFFRLRDELQIASSVEGAGPVQEPVRFMLSAEVSCIYKRHGKVRKVHNLLYVPDFLSAEKVNSRLSAIGNIVSDGRPILGLDSRDLLEILLEEAPEGFLVPAHIWTPWFSVFGSKSGFDSIDECFGDLASHIFALETGLSSDPPMNRLISRLDRFAMISNSDCHSPQKIGREANIFNTGFDYFSMREAIRCNNRESFTGTVEFFPEEGKYHADGHRDCKVCLEPNETRKLDNICPVCGKSLTVGVLHRVMDLADRETPCFAPNAPGVFSLIPLVEMLSEILGVGTESKRVAEEYRRVIARFGSEFKLLLNSDISEITGFCKPLGEAVSRVRNGQVIRSPGFDGEFGVVKVFADGELENLFGRSRGKYSIVGV